MKIKNKITALLASLALLASCKDYEEYSYRHTVGEENNAITLMAGIAEGGNGVLTRAVDDNHEANNTYGGGHTLITTGAKMLLDVRGKWKKTESGTAEDVTKTTTITIGGASAASGNGLLHNAITAYTPQLYWDDYGTADPNNATAGRAEGLTIYGVGVNKSGATVPNIDKITDGQKWTELYWSVGNPSGTPSTIDQSSDWTQYDLITSNNIRQGADGTYKFQDYFDDLKNNTATASNLLEFTHALTKVTVNLTAGEGFKDNKFASKPSVTLLNFNYIGKVNIENKETTATKKDYSSGADVANINMYLAEGGTSNNKAKFEALVFPGNTFSAIIGSDANYTPTSETNILELNADGNIYKVTAAQLVKAIAGTSTTGTTVNGTLEKAKNYILNITVNKTKIEVTATVADWTTVEAQAETPKINVTSTYGYKVGDTGVTNVSAFDKDYDLFRSTNKATGYDENSSEEGIQYAARYTASSSTWDKTIYWPNHQTHYFFRGVFPQVGTTATEATLSEEAVTTVEGNDVIAVANATYKADTYPSDLAIAIPRKVGTNETFDETCKDAGHTAKPGICATEGTINMNFEYAMSQVEVVLKTVDSPDAAKVNIDENTLVELVNVYNTGNVKLSDGSVTTTGGTGSYTLANMTDDDKKLYRLSAIVPQILTYSTEEAQKANNLRFKITIYKSGSTTEVDDIYYADINPILKSGSDTEKVAPNDKWESGKHYIYTLTLSKTAIKVTATITDWKEVKANQNIWF